MGFVFFLGAVLAAAVAVVFAAAVVSAVKKIKNGEPLFGDPEDKTQKTKMRKHIVIALAVVGAFGILPYIYIFFIAAAVWALWQVMRGGSLSRENVLKAAVIFLAAVGAVFSVFVLYGLFSSLIKGQFFIE